MTAAGSTPASWVRPYTLTGGRTRPNRDYPIEALVHTESATEAPTRSPEERAITALCRQSRSVAEVAALVRVPLGVARVLIADLVDRGALQVHTTTVADTVPDTPLLERVLAGLQRL